MDKNKKETAVKRALEGEALRLIAADLEVSPSTIFRWVQKYKKEGFDGLSAAQIQGGRPIGSCKLDRISLLEQLAAAPPSGHAFWSVSDVEKLLDEKFSRQAVMNALKWIGISTLKGLHADGFWDIGKLENGRKPKDSRKEKFLYLVTRTISSEKQRYTKGKKALVCIVAANLETRFKFARVVKDRINVEEILIPLLNEEKKARAIWAWDRPTLSLVVADRRKLIDRKELEHLKSKFPDRLRTHQPHIREQDFFDDLLAGRL